MWDAWIDLPTWLRAVVGFLLVGLAVLIFFLTRGVRIAVVIGAVGLVMILFCGAGNDKSGYNF
jgi:hypothetical protein